MQIWRLHSVTLKPNSALDSPVRGTNPGLSEAPKMFSWHDQCSRCPTRRHSTSFEMSASSLSAIWNLSLEVIDVLKVKVRRLHQPSKSAINSCTDYYRGSTDEAYFCMRGGYKKDKITFIGLARSIMSKTSKTLQIISWGIEMISCPMPSRGIKSGERWGHSMSRNHYNSLFNSFRPGFKMNFAPKILFCDYWIEEP